MTSLDELKSALKDTLETRGVMDQLRAAVRAEIFKALDDVEEPKPRESNENWIVNELIREYLEYNRYKHTMNVFLPETNHTTEPADREFMATQLNVQDDDSTRQVPLLYALIALARQQKPASGSSET